LNKTKRIDPTD